MLIVMEMSTGRTQGEELGRYDDDVLRVAWARMPHTEARLEEFVLPIRREPERSDSGGLMAHLFLTQG
jgi:hypothetical protein